MKHTILLIVCLILSIPCAAQNWGAHAKKNTTTKTTVQQKQPSQKTNASQKPVSKGKNTIIRPQAPEEDYGELRFDPSSTDLCIVGAAYRLCGTLATVSLHEDSADEYSGKMHLFFGYEENDPDMVVWGLVEFNVKARKEGHKMNITIDSYSIKKDELDLIPSEIKKIKTGDRSFTISNSKTSLSATAIGGMIECFNGADIVVKTKSKYESAIFKNKLLEIIANNATDDVVDNKVYDVVEQMPSFPGGAAALSQYLSRTIRYPEKAQKNGVQGRVLCKFVVERDGSISNVEVTKHVDPSIDEEAVRIIRSMPNWTPGKIGGKNVRCSFLIPLTFRL